jgi:predicted ATPase
MTQADLARRLDCATVTLRKIEADERRPAREIVERVGELFHVPAHERVAFLVFARRGVSDSFSLRETSAWQPRVSNFPLPPSPFFGRTAELDTARALLRDKQTRILTLTGVGGIGKTRLALEVGDAMFDAFRDGVYFVDLAPFTNPALVPAAIAQALGVRSRTENLFETLQEHLRGKQLLLLLDNFEQILSAAPIVTELLHASRRVKIIITSRQPLHVAREQILDVPPLDTPNPKRLPALRDLAAYTAVSLFLSNARAARADFGLTPDNARFVAQVCAQLEGIPLTLELAAARVKYFPVQEIASRLEQRFRVLRSTSPQLPARHQTLTATLDWSYELLDDTERALLRRLAVFAGGCTLRAAEQVCADSLLAEDDILHTLTQLADKSLLKVNAETDTARFRMLETIREYAWEKLTDAQEDTRFRNAHLDYFSLWATEITQNEETDAQRHHHFQMERDNVRAAFEWALRTNQIKLGLRMVGTVWESWSATLHVNQYIPFFKLDAARMQLLYEAACAMRKEVDAPTKNKIAYALRCLGVSAFLDADYATTRRFFELSLEYYQSTGEAIGVNNLRNDLGELARIEGDYARAVELFEQNMPLARRVGGEELGVALHNLGQVEMQRGNYSRAYELFEEGIKINLAVSREWRVIEFIAALAELASAEGMMEHAALLAGAVQALLETQGMDLTPADRKTFDYYALAAQTQLGKTHYQALENQGRALTLQQATEQAISGMSF